MKVLRTPDERFSGLVDFPFAPNYLDIDDQDGGTLRMHYLDEGPADGEWGIGMHGQANWSKSFRKMKGRLGRAGYRGGGAESRGWERWEKR